MEYENILLKQEERIATITLNRPEKLNALGDPIFTDLEAALKDVAGDDEVRVVIITGAGRAFCVGGDQDLSGVRRGGRPTSGRERMKHDVGRGRLQEPLHARVMLAL